MTDDSLLPGFVERSLVHRGATIRYLVGARCVTGQVLVIDAGQRFLGLGRDVQFLDAR